MNETTPDIGSVLRQTRIRRGQSLEVVAQQTRIPKKMLEALESNRFEEFPAIVYLRGFLKSYCDHLDVEFEPLWSQIDPAKPKAAAETPESKAEAAPEEESPRDSGGPTLVPLIVVAGLLAAIAAVWFFSQRPAPVEPPAPPAPPSAIAPINAPKELVLRVVARADAWMQLQADGALRFQGRAPAGFQQEWKAMDGFLLRTKDPSALTVTLDGQELPLTDALKTSSGDYKIVRP
ncbi:MAG: DUF4115 domain-containing protein [Elusimicrobia bacterium]|nr:DUF4115 domain-containing protein [Elusimicrobiota bacterium]